MKIQELFDRKEEEINDMLTPDVDARFEKILEHYEDLYNEKKGTFQSSEYAISINFRLDLKDIKKVYNEIKEEVKKIDTQKTTSKQALKLLEKVLEKEKTILDINKKHQEIIEWQKGFLKRNGGAYANHLLKDAESKRPMGLAFALKFMNESVCRIAFIKGRVIQYRQPLDAISS